jgi:hypothetical protein
MTRKIVKRSTFFQMGGDERVYQKMLSEVCSSFVTTLADNTSLIPS